MRNNLTAWVLIASFGWSLACSARAETERKRVRHRQIRQEERIHQGVKSGELTKDEAKSLQTEQKEIQQTKRQDLKDGKLSPEERANLRNMQNKASKDIYEEKHDAEKQPAAQ